MTLAAATQQVLPIAIANPAAANDLITNINTPSPGATSITSTSATAFTVAAAGVNYGLQVDESTASAVTGLKIKPAAAGSGLAISEIGGNSAENLTIDAKGAGVLLLGSISTGSVVIGRGAVNVPIESSTKASIASATPQTATAAQVLGGYIASSGNTSAVTFNTPTAAQLDTAIPSPAVGDTVYCLLANNNTSSGAITITAGGSVTLVGTAALPINKVALLVFVRTAATPTYDCVSVVSA